MALAKFWFSQSHLEHLIRCAQYDPEPDSMRGGGITNTVIIDGKRVRYTTMHSNLDATDPFSDGKAYERFPDHQYLGIGDSSTIRY